MKIRVNKDVSFIWTITINSESVDLSTKDILVEVTEPTKVTKAVEFSAIEDKLYFSYKPTFVGAYVLTCWLNKNTDLPVSALDVEAFECVKWSWMEGEEDPTDLEIETVELEGDFAEGTETYSKQEIDQKLDDLTEYVDTADEAIVSYVDGEIDDLKQKLNKNAYAELNDVDEYFLFEAKYDTLDYDYAKQHFETEAPEVNEGACSTVKFGDEVGRKYDWYDDWEATVVVRTPHAQDHYKTIGTATMNALSVQKVEAREYADEYKLLPFYLKDGKNECGLVAEINVVPTNEHTVQVIEPTVEVRDRICSLMLVRYVLDNFASAAEATDYIKRYVQIYLPQSRIDMGYEHHFMIADADDCFVLEFINGRAITVRSDISTNYRLYGVDFKDDGHVWTALDVADGETPTSHGVDKYGSGLERYNIIVDAIASEDEFDMETLMDDLNYTHTYTNTEDLWYSEFVGGDITVDTPTDDMGLITYIEQARWAYEHRDKDEPLTWISAHSVIYSTTEDYMKITVQENGEQYVFTMDDDRVTRADLDDAIQEAIEYTDSEIERLEGELDGKQDVISDLDTIRSGAALGATSLQQTNITYMYALTQAQYDAIVTKGSTYFYIITD